MTLAYDGSTKKAGLDGNIVHATQLEEIAAKPAKKPNIIGIW